MVEVREGCVGGGPSRLSHPVQPTALSHLEATHNLVRVHPCDLRRSPRIQVAAHLELAGQQDACQGGAGPQGCEGPGHLGTQTRGWAGV